jgi:hypothetical protein
MSDTDPFNDPGNGPAELRKALKAEKQARKALEAQLEELKKSQFSGDVRAALQARGLNPGLARFYPADRPTTDASVDQWVEENRDLFPVQKNDGPAVSEIPANVQHGYQLQKDLQAAEAYTEMDFQSKLAACETQEDVMALLKQYSPPGG